MSGKIYVALKWSTTVAAVILTTSCLLTSSYTRYDDPFCSRADKTGTCNEAKLPSENPSETQNQLMSDYKAKLISHGVNSGCYRVYMNDTEHVSIPVYFYFSCNKDSDCKWCYDRAVVRLKDGCSGKAGGIVKRDHCCLDYEMYDICGFD